MDNFGDRMKEYENAYRLKLPKRLPIIIRIDGKSFSRLTRDMTRPFDEGFSDALIKTADYLCKEVMGCKLAYVASDEISLLLTNYDKLTTESWFDNNLQKLVSISAALATAKFNEVIKEYYPDKGLVVFDSRAWVLPHDEVANYFYWRQSDFTKNSISMVAQANFSHKELQGLNGKQLQDKLMLEKGINWNDIPTKFKRGTALYKEVVVNSETGLLRRKWLIDEEMPIISKNRDYVERFVYLNKEEK